MPEPLTPIHRIQGTDLRSPLAGHTVRLRGVVTGHSRKGYFVQDPDGSPTPGASAAVFVYSPRRKAKPGLLLEIVGEVLDFVAGDGGRPTTQIRAEEIRLISDQAAAIEPVWLGADNLPGDPAALAAFLNGLEGMVVGIAAGATFAAPSNPFGDYVCIPEGFPAQAARHGGVVVDPQNPDRWLPGFRTLDEDSSPRLNLGAVLRSPVVGPLNYRVEAFQIAAQGGFEFEDREVQHERVELPTQAGELRVLTLNGFNLDTRVEDPDKVLDPRRDVDDDHLDGRFEQLARAIVELADSPEIVACQEIQDNDGAELGEVVDATATYELLSHCIRRAGGPDYHWVDIPPEPGGEGGQPGGNIRNAYLYDPGRVELLEGSVRRLGEGDPAYEGSRKPLCAEFRRREGGASVLLINVHLASKRHQLDIFAPEQPGHDPREPIRVRQAEILAACIDAAHAAGQLFYLTGDFNDFEFSRTLAAARGAHGFNLVDDLPPDARYDYNHRGQLQVLMHGIVPRRLHEQGRVGYQILHGNELRGVTPGSMGGKATDHAYVIAALRTN